MLELNAAPDKSNCWTGGVTQGSKCAPVFYIDSCFQRIIIVSLMLQSSVLNISFCLEIIFSKLTLSDRLKGPLRLISSAQQTTKLLFLLVQDQNLLAMGNRTWVFSCPVFARESYSCTMPTKFVALKICGCLS